MANELTITTLLKVSKGSLLELVGSSSWQTDFDGDEFTKTTFDVSTSAVELPRNGFTNCGYMWVRNIGSTTVYLRNGSSGANCVEMRVGEQSLFRWPETATPYAICPSDNGRIEYLVVEEVPA